MTNNKPRIFQAHHKVRTYECDLYGHVNNSIYLNFLEYGRFEVMEEMGYDLQKLRREQDIFIVIRRIEIDYKFPAELGDELTIYTRLVQLRRASGAFHQAVVRRRDEKLVADAQVGWVFINSRGRPVTMPPEFRQVCEENLHVEKETSGKE